MERISGITWSSDANNGRLTTRSFEVYDSMVNVQSINVYQEHHIFDVASIFVWICTRGARDSKLSTGNLQCCADACIRVYTQKYKGRYTIRHDGEWLLKGIEQLVSLIKDRQGKTTTKCVNNFSLRSNPSFLARTYETNDALSSYS